MQTKFLLPALLALAGCSAEPALTPVSEDRIVSLIACISADRCTVRRQTVTMSDGDVMHAVHARGTDGFVYGFFYTENHHFGITMSEHGTLLMVRDDNLDGIVDVAGRTTPTELPSEAPIARTDPGLPDLQSVYVRVMELSDQIVPRNLRGAVARTPTV